MINKLVHDHTTGESQSQNLIPNILFRAHDLKHESILILWYLAKIKYVFYVIEFVTLHLLMFF